MHYSSWPMLIVFAVLLAVGLRAPEPPHPAADLVLLHGNIWTVNKAQPQAEALGIWRDRILKVGTNAAIRGWIGPKCIASFTIDWHEGIWQPRPRSTPVCRIPRPNCKAAFSPATKK
jgi:hypothetical protein